MNEEVGILKEMCIDVKNGLFTITGLKRQWLLLTNSEEWERTEPCLKDNFCKSCDHHKKYHEKEYDGIGFCRKCWDENKKGVGHKFDEKSPELFIAIEKLIPQSTMIHSDRYRVYVYTNHIDNEQIDVIKKSLTLKLDKIEALDKNRFRLIFWSCSYFCSYCHSPFLTSMEKMHHENSTSCYRKPEQVTFVDMVDEKALHNSKNVEEKIEL